MTFRRIRHHYVYVFSDCAICHHYHFLFGMSFLTTKEGMTFRRIRHHYVYVFSDCAICHHYHFLFGMSFLTTKEGMTFRRIRHHYVYVFSDCAICHHYPFPFWYVVSDDKRGDDISSHPPPLCVCLFWLPPGCWKHGGDLEKDLAALAVRLRSQRNVRVRFYYIHFKELESRYMSPIQGILVGFHIMIHIPPTTCTMMCILYYQEVNHWGKLIAWFVVWAHGGFYSLLITISTPSTSGWVDVTLRGERCFSDIKILCVCTAHSSWLSSRHVISLPKCHPPFNSIC